jgi:hypothetical protein
MSTMRFIPTEMDLDIRNLIEDKADYVKYDTMFTQDFLQGLRDEMVWIEN